ncbi:hypothetical protein VTP01DRAFT_9760 [Rhizomucor pusillus]|uniref:uncharacterized protein n=1 Tax=Rhizomucor pusillus TaxID=4840 RepID=UPI003743B8F5
MVSKPSSHVFLLRRQQRSNAIIDTCNISWFMKRPYASSTYDTMRIHDSRTYKAETESGRNVPGTGRRENSIENSADKVLRARIGFTIDASKFATTKRKKWKRETVPQRSKGKMPLVVFGDGMFGKNQTKIKGHECGAVGVLWKMLQRREARGEIALVTISEYNTSQICHRCMSKSLKKLKTEDGVTHHGILDGQTCGMLWNRDTNASKNKYFIARKVWEGFGHP